MDLVPRTSAPPQSRKLGLAFCSLCSVDRWFHVGGATSCFSPPAQVGSVWEGAPMQPTASAELPSSPRTAKARPDPAGSPLRMIRRTQLLGPVPTGMDSGLDLAPICVRFLPGKTATVSRVLCQRESRAAPGAFHSHPAMASLGDVVQSL